uniref:Aminotransferase-like plant mobile domain-containing protein n=1 Tax=Fagus sylvatica TaxID=28930 RepID=A0A2N9F6U2_FAGSY
MASSSSDPDSLVTLRFHDFRVERMRHWWTLLGEDDHADIVGVFGKFPSSSCGYKLIEEYAGLLQLDSPFSETPVIPIQGPRSNRGLEKYLGLTLAVLRPEIIRPEETWWKANISLDLLTKYFSRSDFPVELARDFIAGKKGWKKFRINAFKIAFAGDREREVPDVLHTASSALVLQSPVALLPPPDPLSLREAYAVWRPWTHCALFDGVPLPGVWGCTGYYPSLALRQFGGVQYPPRLGLPYGQVHHILWCLALFGFQLLLVSLRGLLFWRESLRRLGQSCHHYALPGQSEREASAARVESHAEYLASQQCGGGESSPRLGGSERECLHSPNDE